MLLLVSQKLYVTDNLLTRLPDELPSLKTLTVMRMEGNCFLKRPVGGFLSQLMALTVLVVSCQNIFQDLIILAAHLATRASPPGSAAVQAIGHHLTVLHTPGTR